MRRMAFLIGLLSLAGTVSAQTCTTLPYTLTNGTTADASQVMANYNYLLNCFANWKSTGLGVFGTPTFELDVVKSKASDDVNVMVKNSSNTAGARAVVNIVVGGTSAGDPVVVYSGSGIQTWAHGVDNSDGDRFKISASGTLGANDYLTIDSNGNTFVPAKLVGGGTSAVASTYKSEFQGTGSGAGAVALYAQNDDAGSPTVDVSNNATSGNNVFLRWITDNASTVRGSVTYNRSGGLVVYNTTSDYRAKDTFGLFQGAGAIVDAIPVYLGQMKGATQRRPMVVAHEVQAVAPWAVTGDKDAVDKKGRPAMQQLSQGALVELLLAEVQSLRKRIAKLERDN